MRPMILIFLLAIAISANSYSADAPPPMVWVELTFREHDQKVQYLFGTVPANYMETLESDKSQFMTLSNVFFMNNDGPSRYKDLPAFEGVMILRKANIVRVAPLKDEYVTKWKEKLLAPPVPRVDGPVKPPKPPDDKF